MNNDHDGGTVNFLPGKPSGYGKPGSIRFYAPDSKTVMLEITPEGQFLVEGRLVTEDRLVYEGFRVWLQSALGSLADLQAVAPKALAPKEPRRRRYCESPNCPYGCGCPA